jgi:hypothetical protein
MLLKSYTGINYCHLFFYKYICFSLLISGTSSIEISNLMMMMMMMMMMIVKLHLLMLMENKYVCCTPEITE